MVEQPGAVPGKLAAASLVVVVNTAPAASNGPKPKIVLRDALANTIEIIEGAHTRLVYDRPLPDEGLTWDALVDWWATETLHETNLHVAGRHLYDPAAPVPRAQSRAPAAVGLRPASWR